MSAQGFTQMVQWSAQRTARRAHSSPCPSGSSPSLLASFQRHKAPSRVGGLPARTQPPGAQVYSQAPHETLAVLDPAPSGPSSL